MFHSMFTTIAACGLIANMNKFMVTKLMQDIMSHPWKGEKEYAPKEDKS